MPLNTNQNEKHTQKQQWQQQLLFLKKSNHVAQKFAFYYSVLHDKLKKPENYEY